MNKLLLIAITSIAMVACSNDSASNNHQQAENAEHDHSKHNHATTVVGIAHEGNHESGKITISTIHGGEVKNFDYTKSNYDQIAAWLPGDTVTIYLDHHHHGNHSHESVIKIRIGDYGCSHGNNEHNHEHANEDHNHQH